MSDPRPDADRLVLQTVPTSHPAELPPSVWDLLCQLLEDGSAPTGLRFAVVEPPRTRRPGPPAARPRLYTA